MKHTNTLICVVGPTAIGKTSLAIKLAKHFGSEIISADSRQFFKEMNIGTAVPSEDELTQAPHHFIQNKSIFENYNVGKYEVEALAILPELFQKNRVQILVGGSGLYVNAVTKGLDDFPEIDATVRNQINEEYNEKGITFLQEKLETLDPSYFNFIAVNNPQTLQNPQRMKRFVEVCLGTGKPYSSFLGKKSLQRKFNVIYLGIEAPREVIYKRINQRVDIMMANGLLEEVKNLIPYQSNNALQTVGYQELFAYFDGKCSIEEAIEQIKQNTRRFAKRQLTWFKKETDTLWVDYSEDLKSILHKMEQKLEEFNHVI
ncbi:MAG: tRNA (adenosine(37)-N6)-dimethylallyltransferase MiaA [Flavobacteriales bacterium]|nr:tRNA (adenosine(37)-N6)-dimethylallyltransferase MiaA [Flavobacteriales bacterium]